MQAVCGILYEEKLFPLIQVLGEADIVELFTECYAPVLLLHLTISTTLFELSTNFYADMTGFGDRQFY